MEKSTSLIKLDVCDALESAVIAGFLISVLAYGIEIGKIGWIKGELAIPLLALVGGFVGGLIYEDTVISSLITGLIVGILWPITPILIFGLILLFISGFKYILLFLAFIGALFLWAIIVAKLAPKGGINFRTILGIVLGSIPFIGLVYFTVASGIGSEIYELLSTIVGLIPIVGAAILGGFYILLKTPFSIYVIVAILWWILISGLPGLIGGMISGSLKYAIRRLKR
jgi:hypothetical protein